MMRARSLLQLAVRLAAAAIAASLVLAGLALLPAAPLWAASSITPAAPAVAEQGIIAYVNRSTHDIRLISPDGSGDRRLWSAPRPLGPLPAHDLAWRPDGRELAFSSEHEETCSWYQSDVYAVDFKGGGYRRVTNAPACAALAALPKGSVTVNVANYTSAQVQVYVQGAPGIRSVFASGPVTFDNVADLGPGIAQPAVGIYGELRVLASPPLADVQPGATVAGGNLVISPGSGIDALGPGKVSWTADGSALAYGMRTATAIRRLPAVPPNGSIGESLPVVAHAWPRLVAWGPTPATQNQYLYYSRDDLIYYDVAGIYLNTLGDASGGELLAPINVLYGGETVHDIEWLPDGSGFLFTKRYVNLEIYADIFEYNFASRKTTRLTSLPKEDYARGISISPDGRQVVFERSPGELDLTSSLWILDRASRAVRKLIDDAGRPAWGKVLVMPPLTHRVYLPLMLR